MEKHSKTAKKEKIDLDHFSIANYWLVRFAKNQNLIDNKNKLGHFIKVTSSWPSSCEAPQLESISSENLLRKNTNSKDNILVIRLQSILIKIEKISSPSFSYSFLLLPFPFLSSAHRSHPLNSLITLQPHQFFSVDMLHLKRFGLTLFSLPFLKLEWLENGLSRHSVHLSEHQCQSIQQHPSLK